MYYGFSYKLKYVNIMSLSNNLLVWSDPVRWWTTTDWYGRLLHDGELQPTSLVECCTLVNNNRLYSLVRCCTLVNINRLVWSDAARCWTPTDWPSRIMQACLAGTMNESERVFCKPTNKAIDWMELFYCSDVHLMTTGHSLYSCWFLTSLFSGGGDRWLWCRHTNNWI